MIAANFKERKSYKEIRARKLTIISVINQRVSLERMRQNGIFKDILALKPQKRESNNAHLRKKM